MKDLGVKATNDLKFREHMEKMILQSRITMGSLLRTFSTRENEPMLKMYNSYVRSKLEYCSMVWLLVEQKWIDEVQKIQKNFTNKIKIWRT